MDIQPSISASTENHASSSNRWESGTHKKQVLWQILVPLILGFLLIIGVTVLAIFSSTSDYDLSLHWANISLIALILVATVAGLIILILLIGLIYAVSKLGNITPTYTKMGQYYTFSAAIGIITWADKIVQPLLVIQGLFAGSQALLARLSTRQKGNS
jgi:hypothetical protein